MKSRVLEIHWKFLEENYWDIYVNYNFKNRLKMTFLREASFFLIYDPKREGFWSVQDIHEKVNFHKYDEISH